MQQHVGAELLREIERVCKPLPIRFHFSSSLFSLHAHMLISEHGKRKVWVAVFGMHAHNTCTCIGLNASECGCPRAFLCACAWLSVLVCVYLAECICVRVDVCTNSRMHMDTCTRTKYRVVVHPCACVGWVNLLHNKRAKEHVRYALEESSIAFEGLACLLTRHQGHVQHARALLLIMGALLCLSTRGCTRKCEVRRVICENHG